MIYECVSCDVICTCHFGCKVASCLMPKEEAQVQGRRYRSVQLPGSC